MRRRAVCKTTRPEIPARTTSYVLWCRDFARTSRALERGPNNVVRALVPPSPPEQRRTCSGAAFWGLPERRRTCSGAIPKRRFLIIGFAPVQNQSVINSPDHSSSSRPDPPGRRRVGRKTTRPEILARTTSYCSGAGTSPERLVLWSVARTTSYVLWCGLLGIARTTSYVLWCNSEVTPNYSGLPNSGFPPNAVYHRH